MVLQGRPAGSTSAVPVPAAIVLPVDHDQDVSVGQRAFAALSDALLQVAAQRSEASVLERLVETARELAGARYAALGIPDGEGGFSQFLTVGIDEETMERIGPLPRVHGMLGAMLDETEPTRLDDLTADPRFQYWPEEHPVMRSFLGVPVTSGGEVVAAFYLTDKESAPRFSEEDEQLISVLAAHSAVAIENARLWERSREVSTLEERERLARELHDAMSQTLFSLQLTARTAAHALPDDPHRATSLLADVADLARGAVQEFRALLVDLQPPDLEREGLAGALRAHVHLLDRVHDEDVTLTVEGVPNPKPEVERALFRIAQEALGNALRHAKADRIGVGLRVDDDRLVLSVADDGVGFDPSAARVRSTRLGLASMRHRARSVGGRLRVTSTPGQGTTVEAVVPRG